MLILRAEKQGRAEFVFVSFWDSLEAVRAFSGDDLERARYYPEDIRYLLALNPNVRHFEVARAELALPAAFAAAA